MTQTRCVGGRHFSESINQNVFEKLNPKSKTIVKLIKRSCSICGRNKSQVFTNN